MRNALLCFLLGAVAVGASGQMLQGGYTSFPPQPTPNGLLANPIVGPPATEIPMWTYTVTAGADLGGGTYSGTIIGRNPHLPGKTTTTIPLQIVPVKIIINNGGADTHTYDPTVNDGCQPAGHTAVDIVENSPVFTNTTWTMDGVNVGTTQYHDAFLRGSFWSLVAGTSYHLVEHVSVLPVQTVYFGSVGNAGSTSGPGTNYNVPGTFGGGGCGFMGVVDINDLNTLLNNLVASISPTVNIGTLPMLLTDSVVSAVGTSLFSNCCFLGFHSGFNVGPNLQVTSIFVLDYTGVFDGDVSVISHELGEAIFDPTGNNPTPVWGNEGQVEGGCPGGGGQNNLEVGDPLSPGFPTPTNEWVVAGTGPSTGITYHLQELAFFSWFYGGTNLGIPGHYSDHGTFTGDAILCSLGGGTH